MQLNYLGLVFPWGNSRKILKMVWIYKFSDTTNFIVCMVEKKKIAILMVFLKIV